MTFVATKCKDLFFGIGKLLAKISAFLEWLDWELIKQALHDFFKPIFDTLFSWLWAAKGYIETMSLYDHPYLVALGSIIIVIICYFALCYLGFMTRVCTLCFAIAHRVLPVDWVATLETLRGAAGAALPEEE